MKHYMDVDYVHIFDALDAYTHRIDVSMAKYLIALGAQAQRDKIVGPYASSGSVDALQVLKDTAS